jgi:hypothetical protein
MVIHILLIKVELMKLQEEIDNLDMDGKLRQGTSLEFMKPHQTALRKWLTTNASGDRE